MSINDTDTDPYKVDSEPAAPPVSAQNGQVGGVYPPSGPHQLHPQQPKKRALVVSVVLLGVVAIAVIALLLHNHNVDKTADKSNGSTNQASEAAKAEQKAFDTAASQSDTLSNKGDYAKQAEALKAYLDQYGNGVKAPGSAGSSPAGSTDGTEGGEQGTFDHVIQTVAELAAAYLNAGNYQAALQYYQKMLDLSDTPERKMASIHGLALTYQRMGDNANAIAQYRAAIAIAKTLPEGTLANRSSIGDAQSISELGGTP